MQNKVVTTKAKLLSIWGQNGCIEFNKTIKEILVEQVVTPENKEFVVGNEYLKRLPECNAHQLKLLQSIGIEKKKESWSRDATPRNNEYYFLARNTGKELPFKVQKGNSWDAKAVGVYRTEEVAEQEVKIFNLMMLMRNWARYHNQIDKFKAEWTTTSQRKFGIILYGGNLGVDDRFGDNDFLFQISVNSGDRANKMLEEFRKEIEEIFPFL